jgi:hypothetical protein
LTYKNPAAKGNKTDIFGLNFLTCFSTGNEGFAEALHLQEKGKDINLPVNVSIAWVVQSLFQPRSFDV